MNGDLEGFGHVCLHVDLDYLPPLSFSLNEGTLLGNRFVTVHVKIDLFGRWIAVVPKHYLLGGSHASLLLLARKCSLLSGVDPETRPAGRNDIFPMVKHNVVALR